MCLSYRVRFGFYTSITARNIRPIIDFMFDENLPWLKDKILLFERKFNTDAPRSNGKYYGVIRDLNKIWNSDEIKSEQTKFGPENTLMLESDEILLYNCYENSLIIPKYKEEDVWSKDPNHR